LLLCPALPKKNFFTTGTFSPIYHLPYNKRFMSLSSERILYLLRKSGEQTATEEEQQELTDWLANYDDDGSFLLHVQGLLETYATTKNNNVPWDRIFAEIQTKKENTPVQPFKRVHFLKSGWLRYAAAILIVFGIGTYLWNTTNKSKTASYNDENLVHDVLPGGQRALLTLADGSTIILDSADDGKLATQGNSEIIKFSDGEIGYRKANTNREPASVSYNIMSTPKGGQYKMRLPDGTQIWLNAASSIRFPTIFNGGERKVEISGEA
jgi:transmembrane sensor